MTSFTALTKEQRTLKARAGGLAAYAKHGGAARTAAASRGRLAKYERMVLEAAGEDGALAMSEQELAKRAQAALKADMAKLSLASSIARGRRKQEREEARENGSEPLTVTVELPRAICPVCVLLSGEKVGRDTLTAMCETHLLEFYGYVLAKSEIRAAERAAEREAAAAVTMSRSGRRRASA